MKKIEIDGSRKKGNKSILVITGVHGNELTPVYCGFLLEKHGFDKKSFEKITILNAVNSEGIKKNCREIPNDYTSDLNRMFVKEYDKPSEVIDREIGLHDIVIDIHSSPRTTEMILLNQNEYTNSYMTFINDNKLPYVIRYSNTNTIKKYSTELGKISFTIELNKMGEIDYSSAVRGVDIVSKIIGNYKDICLVREEPKYETYFEFSTYREGLFVPSKNVGDLVRTGEELGYVLNLDTFEQFSVIYTKQDARLMFFDEIQYCSGERPICYLQP